MELIYLAAQVASDTLAVHGKRFFLEQDWHMASTVYPPGSLSQRWHLDEAFKDTEEVIEHIWQDIPVRPEY